MNPAKENMLAHPVLLAAVIAAAYLVLCVFYIFISGGAALEVARDLHDLHRMEQAKGWLFMVVSSAGLFAFLAVLFSRLHRQQRQIHAHQEALIQSERRAMAGVQAASVAHDVNNVVGALEAETLLLRDARTTPAERAESLERVSDSIRMLREMARRLRDIGRRELSHEFRDGDLSQVVRETIGFASRHRALAGAHVEFDPHGPVIAELNRHMLEQSLMNLLINAGEAAGERPRVKVTLEKVADGNAVVEIHDNGPGIREQELARVFEPFYTTKKEGTGLGLLTVKACVEMHCGRLEIVDSPLGGACFRLILPMRHPITR